MITAAMRTITPMGRTRSRVLPPRIATSPTAHSPSSAPSPTESGLE